MKRIWNLSDTHSLHNSIRIPENIDIVIHAGDCSNYKDPYRNEGEVRDFISWYSKLDIKYKIYVAGNHDTSIERKLITKDNFDQAGIIYLEHEIVNIEGINIFGSPYTPSFNDWSFNVARHKLEPYWDEMPEYTDILVTHGPPKGILDCANHEKGMEYCGDKSLLNKVIDLQSIKYHIFGHIHNNDEHMNQGMRTIQWCNTKFMNVSCVTDAKFKYGCTSHGIIIDY